MNSVPVFQGHSRAKGKVKDRAFFASIFLSCALCSGPLIAQERVSNPTGGAIVPGGTSEDAIVVGPFLFSPALQLTWQDRDNIFYTPVDEVRDQVWLARAQLLFEVPINESHVYFSYSPQYTDYRTYELLDKWSHFFDAGGSFIFSNGLAIRATYNYIVGNLETREVDPGGELYYGDPQFIKNFAAVAADYWLTQRDGVFVDFSWTDLDHSEPRFFYDYTSLAAGLGWLHQLSPNLVMDLRYGVIDFDAHDTEYQSNQFRDSLSHTVTVGFRGQLSPVVSTEAQVGYRTIRYDLQPGDPPVSDFSGFIVNGLISWDMAHGSVLNFDVLHSPFPSNYADNASYVATGAGLTYSLDRGTVFGQAHGRFQNNDYELPDPITSELRSDDILSLGLGLGYRFTDHLSFFGSYLYEDRDSLFRYSYTINIFTLGLVLGF
jgi:opacity protein-like surface antigen